MATQKEYWKQTTKDLKGYNEGLKDQISYQNQLGDLKKKMRTADEREMKVLKDVVDKTKTIFQNRKSITEEREKQVEKETNNTKIFQNNFEETINYLESVVKKKKKKRKNKN